MKVALFIGSFNPPHLGHKKIAEKLLEYVDRVYIIPTGNYWHKNNLIDLNDRINMLKFFEKENIFVHKTSNEYAYQIIEEFSSFEVYLVIGSDNLEKFHLWKKYDELIKKKIIVVARNNDVIDSDFIKLEGVDMNISSTMVRGLVLNNKEIDHLVGLEIKKYIKENNLYGGNYV